MELKTERHGEILVIYLEGKFDLQQSIEVESELNRLLEEGNKYLVFDLGEVKYISSSGLRIFIATMRELNTMNGGMKISNISDQIKKFFEVVGMLELLAIYPTVKDAIEAFD